MANQTEYDWVWRFLRGFFGGVMILLCIIFLLGIWIHFFDNDGGEPGAATIFGSIPFWPLFGILIILGSIACAFLRWLFFALLVLTFVLFVWDYKLTQTDRAKNLREWEEQSRVPYSVPQGAMCVLQESQ